MSSNCLSATSSNCFVDSWRTHLPVGQTETTSESHVDCLIVVHKDHTITQQVTIETGGRREPQQFPVLDAKSTPMSYNVSRVLFFCIVRQNSEIQS